MARLMPLPLTVSFFRKIQIGLSFWYPLSAHPGSPGQRAIKWVLLLLLLYWQKIFSVATPKLPEAINKKDIIAKCLCTQMMLSPLFMVSVGILAIII